MNTNHECYMENKFHFLYFSLKNSPESYFVYAFVVLLDAFEKWISLYYKNPAVK